MKFLETILRGIGQVMFQNNWFSGLLFLIALFYNSWLLGLATLFGTLISTIAAQILKYSTENIENGLYGFNGALTGVAVLCFFEVTTISISALIIGTVLSTIVMNFLKKFLPPFTAPFVMVTWLVIYSLLFIFKFSLLPSSTTSENSVHLFIASSKSFGQVMFQENTITGLLFLVAIFINNKLNAIYATYAAVLGSLAGWLFSESFETINSGLMGYNAILCAIALTGNKGKDFLWITLSIILSTLLNILLAKTGIITLTAPFVITTWIILFVKKQKINSLKLSSETKLITSKNI